MQKKQIDFFKRTILREFITIFLYHSQKSQFENLNSIKVNWNQNEDDFKIGVKETWVFQ